jgi:hypothetical protein
MIESIYPKAPILSSFEPELTKFSVLLCRLLKRGYSLESIANATLQADTISQGRMASANKQNWERMSEVSERFGRYIKKAFVKKSLPAQATVAANSA